MAEDRNALLDFLTRHYTLDGLKTLCFNLFIDYDNLSGDTKSARGRELILHLERAGRLVDLEAVVGREQHRLKILFHIEAWPKTATPSSTS